MATNTLNMLYSIQKNIAQIEKELKKMKESERELLDRVLSSGSLENRYYRLTNKVRKGDRVLNIVLLEERYPEVYNQCRIVSAKVTDVQKLLGDQVIDEISVRKPDSITWICEKKIDPVMVV